uniref:Carboxylesterase type B domain-containing protein n=1 Tax=Parascaris equorum TaxID=6256 RepID=A0A914RS92_PAREQ
MQRCVEFWFRGTTAQGTEDCLHMDIVVPTSVSMQNRSLPILIWIHGGSYQIQAIRWLKANARNFDGNPELITLGGESAGAASASLLAISPKTKAPWAVRSSSTENNSARLMDFCGCPYNSSLGMVHTLACLKSIPIQRLLNGWHHVAVTVSDF